VQKVFLFELIVTAKKIRGFYAEKRQEKRKKQAAKVICGKECRKGEKAQIFGRRDRKKVQRSDSQNG
jgi:hypothetical protein